MVDKEELLSAMGGLDGPTLGFYSQTAWVKVMAIAGGDREGGQSPIGRVG
jgi:hypothetical protein